MGGVFSTPCKICQGRFYIYENVKHEGVDLKMLKNCPKCPRKTYEQIISMVDSVQT